MPRLSVLSAAVVVAAGSLAAEAAAQTAQVPAKLAVKRAVVKDGRLDVRAAITSLAKGNVNIRYRAAGTTTTFATQIDDGRVSISKLLPLAQRRRRTGIVTLTYPGSDGVRFDRVRLRAAPRKARLRLASAAIDDLGALLVSGTISARARGTVRLRLEYTEQGGIFEVFARAAIVDGRWSVEAALPRPAAAIGGQLSIQFTGYALRKIRGEQISRHLTP
jgi:hypothetical protein